MVGSLLLEKRAMSEKSPDNVSTVEMTRPDPFAKVPKRARPMRNLIWASLLYAALWTGPSIALMWEAKKEVFTLFCVWMFPWFFLALPCGLVAGFLATRLEHHALQKLHPGRWAWIGVGALTLTAAHFAPYLLFAPFLVAHAFESSWQFEERLLGAFVALLFWLPVITGCAFAGLAKAMLQRRQFTKDHQIITKMRFPLRLNSRLLIAIFYGLAAFVPSLTLFAWLLEESGASYTPLFLGLWAIVGALLIFIINRRLGGVRRNLAVIDSSFTSLDVDKDVRLAKRELAGTIWTIHWLPLYLVGLMPRWNQVEKDAQWMLITSSILMILLGALVAIAAVQSRYRAKDPPQVLPQANKA